VLYKPVIRVQFSLAGSFQLNRLFVWIDANISNEINHDDNRRCEKNDL